MDIANKNSNIQVDEDSRQSAIFKISQRRWDSDLNLNKCNCCPSLPKMKLFKVVYCGEIDNGAADKHHHIEFETNSIKEYTYYRNVDANFIWSQKGSELHYKLFKSKFENAHNAAYDASSTAKCFWELLGHGII